MAWLRRAWAALVAFYWPTQEVPAPAAAPQPKKLEGIKISASALAQAGGAQGVDLGEVFRRATPAPGVLPKGQALAMDSALDDIFGYCISDAYHEGVAFLGYPVLSQMTVRPEYRRPAEILAKEMTRKWIKFQASGDEDKSDKIKAIRAEFDRLQVQDCFRKAIEQDGWFGRSQIFIDTGNLDPDELATPLSAHPEKINRLPLKRLVVIEPMWTYPNAYDSMNPLSPKFFKPESWFVQGTNVHGSRLMTIIGRPVPDILKPAYQFGGLSLSQMMKPYVDNWLRTRQSVSDLLHSFTVFVLSTNMGDILNGGAAQGLFDRVSLFNQMRDNRGAMVVNKETEDLTNVSAPLGGLDHLQAQSQEHMSAACGIPLVKLLGITPSGLNTSTDGEMESFYGWLEAEQQTVIRPELERLLNIVQLTLFGEIDPEIGFAFEPMWTMKATDIANLRKTEVETDAAAINAGIIDPAEARKRIASEEDSPYAGIDPDEVPQPPQQPGGMGGEMGGLGGFGGQVGEDDPEGGDTPGQPAQQPGAEASEPPAPMAHPTPPAPPKPQLPVSKPPGG